MTKKPPKNKPTPEELQKKVDEAAAIPEEELQTTPEEEETPEDKEIEKQTKEQLEKETPEDKEIEKQTKEQLEKEETEEELIEPDEEQEEETEEEQAEPSKELYKKKFSESSKEAQKIAAKNRVINKALIEAEDIPEPTEEEMKQAYPSWEEMSEVEQGLAKETVISRKWRQTIAKAKEQATKIEKWNDSVDTFIDDPKTLNDNSELEGKTDAFREYAKREEHNNVPFAILVSAFLHESQKNQVKNKGKMFERGKGGPSEKPQQKSNKITLEEARKLRQTNPTKWKEYLSRGLIDYNV